MRLIHVPSMDLQEFIDNQCPDYAILSHTWGPEEITYQVFRDTEAGRRTYCNKIKYLCDQARKDRLDYVWIDTACIDKSSSSELSEAINSMMSWYGAAKVCYAYLEDVEDLSQFERCRWFTRGWTLQELIAPQSVQFYGMGWSYLGDKSTLISEIAAATGIHQLVLKNPYSFSDFSIATRMSWAAKRNTTRVEDIAYCLLGIFEVNMPTLYGERENAFIRLQKEIIKTSHDESILAWCASSDYVSSFMGLAPHPSWFSHIQNIIPLYPSETHNPLSVTNRGLLTNMPLLEDIDAPQKGRLWGILNCRYECCFLGYVGIPLSPSHFNDDTYSRSAGVPPRLISIKEAQNAESRTFYIHSQVRASLPVRVERYICQVKSDLLTSHGYQLTHPYTLNESETWDAETQISEIVHIQFCVESVVCRFLFHNPDRDAAFQITVVQYNGSRQAVFKVEQKPEEQDSQSWIDEFCAQPDPTFPVQLLFKLKRHGAAKIEVLEWGRQIPLKVYIKLKQQQLLGEDVWVLDVSSRR